MLPRSSTSYCFHHSLCPKWHAISYLVHYFRPGFWSKEVHYVGNRVRFGAPPLSVTSSRTFQNVSGDCFEFAIHWFLSVWPTRECTLATVKRDRLFRQNKVMLPLRYVFTPRHLIHTHTHTGHTLPAVRQVLLLEDKTRETFIVAMCYGIRSPELHYGPLQHRFMRCYYGIISVQRIKLLFKSIKILLPLADEHACGWKRLHHWLIAATKGPLKRQAMVMFC